jgi:hypothetical protein
LAVNGQLCHLNALRSPRSEEARQRAWAKMKLYILQSNARINRQTIQGGLSKGWKLHPGLLYYLSVIYNLQQLD